MFAFCFHDNLAGFGSAFVAAHDAAAADVTPAADLCRPDALDRRLERFAFDRGCTDRRATASQWSKWLFSRLVIPTTVIQLSTDRHLVADLGALSIAWHDDATPNTVLLPPDAFAIGRGSDFSGLIDTILTPLVVALTGRCRLSPRVFWSNAATYYDWVIDELARQDRIPASRWQTANDLRTGRLRDDGGFNPFGDCTQRCAPGALDGNGQPTVCCRRMCCMRDLDRKWGLCANCPRAIHFVCERPAGIADDPATAGRPRG